MTPQRFILSSRSWYLPLVNSCTGLLVKFWISAVSCALRCFKFSSNVRRKAQNLSGIYFFMGVDHLNACLTDTEHVEMISFVVHLRLSFSARNVACLDSRVAIDLDIVFKLAWIPFRLTLHSSCACLSVWVQKRAFENGLELCSVSFLRLVDIPYASWYMLAKLTDWALSVPVAPTTSFGRSGQGCDVHYIDVVFFGIPAQMWVRQLCTQDDCIHSETKLPPFKAGCSGL